MVRTLVACLVLVPACGFTPGATGTRDAAGSGDGPRMIDAPLTMPDAPTKTCFAKWVDGTISFMTPARIATLDTSALERDPWISADETRVYFSSNRSGSLGGTDSWTTTRTGVTGTWGTPEIATDVSTSDGQETKVSLTADGLYAVVGSTHTGGKGGVDVWETTRAQTTDAFGALEQVHLASVNDGANQQDPTISADGLHLYLAPDTGGTQHIVMASRASRADDFGVPTLVVGIDSSQGDADPSVSADETIIVFSSMRSGGLGGSDIYYALKDPTTHLFGTPVRVPTVNSSSNDGDPHLSADGCRLYFSSDRNGGQSWDLAVAEAMP